MQMHDPAIALLPLESMEDLQGSIWNFGEVRGRDRDEENLLERESPKVEEISGKMRKNKRAKP